MPKKDSSFKDQVLNNIHQLQPKPKWRHVLFEVSYLILIGLLIIIAISSLTRYLTDIWLIWQLRDFTNFSITWGVFSKMMIEFLLLAIVAGFLMYLIYRRTDWPLVRHSGFLALIIGLTIIVSSTLAVYSMSDSRLEDFREDSLKLLPHRNSKKDLLREELEDKSLFLGRLESIRKTSDGWELVVANPRKRLILISDFKIPNQIEQGEQVMVVFEKKGDIYYLQKIEQLPKRRPRFLKIGFVIRQFPESNFIKNFGV